MSRSVAFDTVTTCSLLSFEPFQCATVIPSSIAFLLGLDPSSSQDLVETHAIRSRLQPSGADVRVTDATLPCLFNVTINGPLKEDSLPTATQPFEDGQLIESSPDDFATRIPGPPTPLLTST